MEELCGPGLEQIHILSLNISQAGTHQNNHTELQAWGQGVGGKELENIVSVWVVNFQH